MSANREKFATQIDGALLSDLRALARDEGRQIQALVEEAIALVIEEHRQGRPRSHVMRAYQKSHARFESLYRKLAE